MATVKNGRLDRSTLVEIRRGQRLRADAANAFNRMNAAFKQRFGRDIGVTDSYRDYDQQVDVKRRKGPLAATPGTSNHGWAIALDLGTNINVHTSAEHQWMDAYASRYGWVNPAWARDNNPRNGAFEPWHWEYVPALDGGAGGILAARPVATSTRKTGKPMIYRAGNDKKTPFGIYGHNGGWVILSTAEERANLLRAGVPEVWVEKTTLDNLIADSRA